jgi:hypothetical protein
LSVPAEIDLMDAVDEADGVDDWQTRRVTVVLTP